MIWGALEAGAVIAANENMASIAQDYLRRGLAKTNEEAVRRACQTHGKLLAIGLQRHLQELGVQDVTVTCP